MIEYTQLSKWNAGEKVRVADCILLLTQSSEVVVILSAMFSLWL